MKLKPYVEVSGKGANLVLLHGWGLHGGIWQTILPILESQFTIYNVDLPGFGHSPIHNGDYDLDYLVSSIESILPEKCFVMGWSLGGVVATALSSRYPNKIEKLITVASSPCFVAGERWDYGMKKEVLESFIAYLAEDFKGTLIKFLSIQTMGSPTQKQDITRLKETVFIHGIPAEKALSGGLEILNHVNLLDSLTKLNIPFLRIYGKLDQLVPVKSANQVEKYSPDSTAIIFERSGHAPFLSESEKFVKQVIRFLKS